MRFFVGILATLARTRRQRRNLRLLGWMAGVFIGLLAVFSVIFHWLMAREGQQHSWVTSVYWTFVTMSTLGFGDITFESDAGRLFTIVVLITGTIFLLVLLPFTFIQFFFLPWMEASEAAGTPRKIPAEVRDHVVLTRLGPVEESLVRLLTSGGIEHCLVVEDHVEAGRLLDAGYRVMVGPLDDPATYRNARISQAALVATTLGDTTNTNVTFTVREVNAAIPIVATAASEATIDILTMAGCTQVLQLGRMLGEAMARRLLGRDGRSRVVGRFDDLLIAEASAKGTPLVGRTLGEIGLRQATGASAVGVWYRGHFRNAGPDTLLHGSSLLVLAGSREQLARYDELFGLPSKASGLAVIIGGGRVGRAAAAALAAEGQDYRLVEKNAARFLDPARSVHGDAAERAVLEAAGLDDCSAVMITTHDDDTNIYLTLYCRKLRPDVQIIARSNRERNIETLHRAGADFVVSYATFASTMIYNLLRRIDILTVAEGLHVFRLDTPRELWGRTLAEAGIRRGTGCSVIAVGRDDHFDGNPDSERKLDPGDDLVLVGDAAAEQRFMRRYGRG